MNEKPANLARAIILIVAMVLCFVITAITLYNIQITDSETYRELSERRSTRSMTENAARGEITDRYGRPLISNKMAFSLALDYYSLDKDTQNELILRLVDVCNQYEIVYNDSMPITKTVPIEYVGETDDIESFIEFAQENKIEEEDAERILNELYDLYEIADTFTSEEKRIIAGIRYEMDITQFSTFNPFTFASDIPVEMVSQVEESFSRDGGINIETESIREYETTYAAHILGNVGVIYADEWDEYKELGYPMDAIIGKSGVEKAFEEFLRGVDGKVSIETDLEGNETNATVIEETTPGNDIMLTIDLALQEATEQSLALRIPEIRENGANSASGRGADTKGAAAVVLDVNTGEVLAMASYPTYNLETFNKDFNALNSDELKPMINRAMNGLYQPGSTYKVSTSVAALEEGVVEPDTIIRCQGIYTFYEDYQPRCWWYTDYGTTHGNVNCSGALQGSCNYYYYEVGRLLGGEVMEDYSHALGLGEYTGIELEGEYKGNVAGPDSREEDNLTWIGGDSLQAAIGQSDHQFTPLQLASYISTVVNGGTRYQVHLLKEVKSHDFSEDIFTTESTVLGQVEISPENLEAIKEGMNDVVNEGGTAANVFRNYPLEIGGKSGSAETGIAGEDAHGLFVAFAPYDNPEIAICVVGENAGSGSNVAPVVRDILDAYFFSDENTESITPNYTLLP